MDKRKNPVIIVTPVGIGIRCTSCGEFVPFVSDTRVDVCPDCGRQYELVVRRLQRRQVG